MQFIGDDMKQLNSSVVRVFKKVYPKDVKYDLSLLTKNEQEFCVHVVDIKKGEAEGLWHKVGNEEIVGADNEVYFKGSYDSGNPEIKLSKNWFVWKLGDEKSFDVDFDDEILSRSFIDLIVQPSRVYEMIKNNGKYPGFYQTHK